MWTLEYCNWFVVTPKADATGRIWCFLFGFSKIQFRILGLKNYSAFTIPFFINWSGNFLPVKRNFFLTMFLWFYILPPATTFDRTAWKNYPYERVSFMSYKTSQPLTTKKPKLLDQVRAVIRTKHYSFRTEQAYIHWLGRSSSAGEKNNLDHHSW